MYTGWLSPFKHKGTIQPDERDRELKRDIRNAQCDEHVCLTRFNSTYIELIDRRYRVRGMFGMVFALCVVVTMLWLIVWFTSDTFSGNEASSLNDVGFWLFAVLFVSIPVVLVWWLYLRKEFFTYTRYPIRFNRKTRMVHAFFGAKEGGVVSVPWEQAFFHIGHTESTEDFLRDIRCHVTDEQGNITRTFAVGHYFDNDQAIRGIWEFIRRYMQDGPDKVVDDPKDAGVCHLSTNTGWRNCFHTVVVSMPDSWFSMRYVLSPLYLPFILCRWLVFKSCKSPVFSPEIEASCQIEAGDLHIWKEPAYQAQYSDIWMDEKQSDVKL